MGNRRRTVALDGTGEGEGETFTDELLDAGSLEVGKVNVGAGSGCMLDSAAGAGGGCELTRLNRYESTLLSVFILADGCYRIARSNGEGAGVRVRER